MGRSVFIILALAATPASGHEMWILAPDEALRLNALPKPEIFTRFTPEGLALLALFGLGMGALLALHYGTTPRWLVAISGRSRRHPDLIPTVLRACAAWSLVSAAFALDPQVGTPPMTAPYFLAPDLLIGALGADWLWLRWAQLALGLWLLSGVWIRGAGLTLVALVMLGSALYGTPMASYALAWLGMALYLVARGGGRFTPPVAALRSAPVLPLRDAQLILRVATGLTFLLLGLYYKVLQPNLAVGIIRMYEAPILIWAPETFVFMMALIECCGGLLILTGIAIRIVSACLLGAFLFFATILPESYTAHMQLYGVMIAFLLGGPGRSSRQGRYEAAHAARG